MPNCLLIFHNFHDGFHFDWAIQNARTVSGRVVMFAFWQDTTAPPTVFRFKVVFLFKGNAPESCQVVDKKILIKNFLKWQLHFSKCKTKENKWLHPTVNRKTLCNTALVSFQVFNCRTVDHDVGLGYLCSIPKQTAFQYLVAGTNFLGQSCSKILVRALMNS